jgi:hypothetical protein
MGIGKWAVGRNELKQRTGWIKLAREILAKLCPENASEITIRHVHKINTRLKSNYSLSHGKMRAKTRTNPFSDETEQEKVGDIC